MTNFDFGMTAGASQNGARQNLEGNLIHEVTFDGCEARDIQGVQDPSKTFKVLDIKFSNKQGTFTDTVWEPKDTDYEDRQGPYGPQPSNVKAMMLKFKHLIDAVNPELAEKVDKGESKLTASSWDGLRKLMVKATENCVGKATKIKLIKNNKGEAIFPYFANYDKTGKLYMSTNFIGDNIFWKTKELEKINAAKEAKPTDTESTTAVPQSTADIDFTF